MKIFTKQELEQMGMSDVQIQSILNTQNYIDTNNTNVEPKDEKEVEAPKKVYTEADITSIIDIQKVSGGEVVELPGFDGQNPFIAKLKRPSLLMMVKTGKIPNTLINQATQLFQRGAGSLGKDNTVSDMYDIMTTVCEAALVNPSYADLKANGISLTDEQMMAIFSYTQQGVKALEQFRKV